MKLKEYQIKQLERISLASEKTEALEVLQPSMTTLLDYQIKRLEGSHGNPVNIERLPSSTIECWTKTLELLKEARELYN